jgi:shikimate kinase
MKKNIVLMGFMGTGKSSVGRLLAAQLKMEFLDMDTVIEGRAGKPITRIFADEGEPVFRALERSLAQELAAQEGRVIATGGGIVLNPDNVRDFSATGLVVCLMASAATILSRVGRGTQRPLLDVPDKLGRIRDLLAKRVSFYESVPNPVGTDGLTAEEVARRVLLLYRPA